LFLLEIFIFSFFFSTNQADFYNFFRVWGNFFVEIWVSSVITKNSGLQRLEIQILQKHVSHPILLSNNALNTNLTMVCLKAIDFRRKPNRCFDHFRAHHVYSSKNHKNLYKKKQNN